MPLTVTCDNCEKEYRVADEMAGKTLRCKACKAAFVAKATVTEISAAPPIPAARPASRPAPPPVKKYREEPYRAQLADDDEDDDDRPRRRRPSRRSRPTSGLPVSWPIVLAVVGGFWIIGVGLVFVLDIAGLALLSLGGFILCMTGSVMLLVIAFQEDIVCGICTLLVPFYGLYYIMSRYERTWRAFHLSFYGACYFITISIVAALRPVAQNNAGMVQQRPNAPMQNIPMQKGAPPIAQPMAKRTGDANLDDLLAKLNDPASAMFAAIRLSQTPVDPQHQAVVARELVAVVKGKDRNVGSAALNALAVWGSANEVPLLIEMIGDVDGARSGSAIRALAKLRDERAIKPLAAALSKTGARIQAEFALKEFGVAAEPEVIPQLKSFDTSVVMSAIRVLERVGTPVSIPHLQPIAESKGATRTPAQNAIRSIQARAKKG
jgi:hypothetical protein